jgi:hypothetical protein
MKALYAWVAKGMAARNKAKASPRRRQRLQGLAFVSMGSRAYAGSCLSVGIMKCAKPGDCCWLLMRAAMANRRDSCRWL